MAPGRGVWIRPSHPSSPHSPGAASYSDPALATRGARWRGTPCPRIPKATRARGAHCTERCPHPEKPPTALTSSSSGGPRPSERGPAASLTDEPGAAKELVAGNVRSPEDRGWNVVTHRVCSFTAGQEGTVTGPKVRPAPTLHLPQSGKSGPVSWGPCRWAGSGHALSHWVTAVALLLLAETVTPLHCRYGLRHTHEGDSRTQVKGCRC